MTDSRFELDPPLTDPEAAEGPGEAPARRKAPEAPGATPTPRRGRRRRGGPPQETPTGAGAPAHGALWRTLCGGRLLYGISAVLSACALGFLYNPHFGARRGVWFWEVLRDADGGLAATWTQDTADVVILLAITLGYLTCTLVGRGRGRGLFALAWVAVAFVAFSEMRGGLRFYLPIALIGGMAGALLYAGHRGPAAVRVVLVAGLLLGAYLFMPLPPRRQTQLFPRAPQPTAYRSIAVGTVHGHVSREEYRRADGEVPGQLEHSFAWLKGWLPQHAMLLLFALGLVWLLGLRAAWIPPTAAVLTLLLVLSMAAVSYEFGVESSPNPAWPSWWAGAYVLGEQWTGRFLASVLALAAAMGDVARRE